MKEGCIAAAAQDEYMQQAQLREAALARRVASLESILSSAVAAHAAGHHTSTDRGHTNHPASDPGLRCVA